MNIHVKISVVLTVNKNSLAYEKLIKELKINALYIYIYIYIYHKTYVFLFSAPVVQ
jgi:hypothetical protein